jgi:hypothetical protein
MKTCCNHHEWRLYYAVALAIDTLKSDAPNVRITHHYYRHSSAAYDVYIQAKAGISETRKSKSRFIRRHSSHVLFKNFVGLILWPAWARYRMKWNWVEKNRMISTFPRWDLRYLWMRQVIQNLVHHSCMVNRVECLGFFDIHRIIIELCVNIAL